MQINVKAGKAEVKLTKTERRKLREARDLADALATHGQSSEAELTRDALDTLLAKYTPQTPEA